MATDLDYQHLPWDVEEIIRNKMYRKDGLIGYMAFVYVAEEYRGRGVAQNLLKESFCLLSVTIQYFGAMALTVSKDKESVIALYKKVGYIWIKDIGKYSYFANFKTSRWSLGQY
mmetsp:Transcript_13715/g.14871  ORF Transcript_13715/g.14871 Transcript_13715/m.14871 type:complete len:114 (+) Transcript_13715:11-352(+)